MDWIQDLQAAIEKRRLLDHSFYQRWNRGELTLDELRDYARQYYHYALAFPTFLSGTHANSSDLAVRQAILENLIEEEHGTENHPELWLRFCEALGLERAEVLASEPNAGTKNLIDTLRTFSREGEVHEGLAGLYAYESQVPAVAQAKIDGLAKFYEIRSAKDIAFFQVHLAADVAHSRTSEGLLRRLCDTDQKREEASEAVAATLEALYGFLDGVSIPSLATVN